MPTRTSLVLTAALLLGTVAAADQHALPVVTTPPPQPAIAAAGAQPRVEPVLAPAPTPQPAAVPVIWPGGIVGPVALDQASTAPPPEEDDRKPSAETPKPPAAAKPPRGRIEAAIARPANAVNIRIDATVIESRGEQVTGKKVVSVTVVDGEQGAVRSSQRVPVPQPVPKAPAGVVGPSFSYVSAPLNMDARANLQDDGRVRVSLALDYRGAADAPATAENAEAPTLNEGIRQQLTVLLDPGKPLIVAQSADAVGDRRVALEVKATVLK